MELQIPYVVPRDKLRSNQLELVQPVGRFGAAVECAGPGAWSSTYHHCFASSLLTNCAPMLALFFVHEATPFMLAVLSVCPSMSSPALSVPAISAPPDQTFNTDIRL